MTAITDLSPEILHNLLCNVEALDLASLSRSCQYLRSFIAGDDLLWKRVYLAKFDSPRRSPSTSWAQALQNLVITEKLLQSKDYVLKRSQTAFITSQILPLVLSTQSTAITSLNTAFLARHFHHASRQSNASIFLRQSSLFRHCGLHFDDPASTIADRQASARLHVYSSLSLEVRQSELLDEPGAREIHPYARSRVYDLRRYKAANFWGPFMDDGSGRIDWEKVQAIFIVLGFGLRMLNERSGGVISGATIGWCKDDGDWEGLAAGSYKSAASKEKSREDDEQSDAATAGSVKSESDGRGKEPRDLETILNLDTYMMKYEDPREARFQYEQAVFAAQDPYGVKGTWMRIVNFLDYHDLFAFNFTGHTPPEGIEREPVSTAEAFRLIYLKLWVTKIEWPDEEVDVSASASADEWETVDGSQASSTPALSPSPVEQNTPDNGKCKEHEPSSNAGPRNSIDDETVATPGSSTSTSTAKTGKKKSKYPIVHFAGRSRSLHVQWDPNANSHIRGSNPFYSITGYVRAYPSPPTPAHEHIPDYSADLSHVYPAQIPTLPPLSTNHTSGAGAGGSTGSTDGREPPLSSEDDLVVRWTTFSVFHGEERWRSEGVQIGGLKSARGILGNWFDKDYDPHGPAGPTGFWKLGDKVELHARNKSVVEWGDVEG